MNKQANSIELSYVMRFMHERNFRRGLVLGSPQSQSFSVLAHSEHGIFGLMVPDLKEKRGSGF